MSTNTLSNPSYPRSAAAIIVAAGRGERAGSAGGPKQYRSVGGRTIIRRTLDAIRADGRIDRIVVAIHPDDEALFNEAAGPVDERTSIVFGGATRQDSVRRALEALKDTDTDAVLIHDGVRPFVDAGLLDRIVTALGPTSGACPVLPVVDTLKRGSDSMIRGTVERKDLYGAQTPQAFPFPAILAAHQQAAERPDLVFTDDASLAEWVGMPVRLVEGDPENLKLTYPRDIDMANAKLAGAFPDVRTGNGYDVHSFEPGDAVFLAGVRIPHTKKLSGHSDADVALHALTDALLATIGAGDIGTHFPPSDPQWRGAASHIFVEHAVKLVRARGGRIANADITLICEAPKIGPHRDAMTAALTDMLGISADRVSVKATTNERLGFVGREEGIASIATATVVYPGGVPE